jgi:1-acyl-sn-glycerol-3-phosphate acyltransferase
MSEPKAQRSDRVTGIKAVIGRAWLSAFGWTVSGGHPGVHKAVVVAAPHTSNWDWPFTIAVGWAIGVKMQWVGKHTLFKGPMGPIMRAFGGVSVDRRSSHNFVQQIVDRFAMCGEDDELMIVISPEGSRSKVGRWKTGFYHMARSANVPIILGFLDYERKQGGLGTIFWPTGDLEADAAHLREFYKHVRGRNQRQMSEISFGGEDVSLTTTRAKRGAAEGSGALLRAQGD